MLSKEELLEFTPESCEKYRGYMFNIAYKIVQDNGYAEDIVQETMFRLINVSQELSGKTEKYQKNYITKAVTNNAISYMEKVWREVPTDKLAEQAALDNVLEKIVTTENTQQMLAILDELTPKQGLALLLLFYKNWTTKEVAKELNMTPAGVRMLKQRAFASLRNILNKKEWDK